MRMIAHEIVFCMITDVVVKGFHGAILLQDGTSALAMATIRGHDALIEMLIEYGVQVDLQGGVSTLISRHVADLSCLFLNSKWFLSFRCVSTAPRR